MASRVLEMALILILAALFWGGATAQSNSISNCNNALATMAPCLNYLMANSSTPSASCCSQLSAVVKSSPDCLCAALNGNVPSIGININRTIALSLPGACQVQTPSFNQCKQAVAPAASPTDSPTTISPSSDSPTTISPSSGSSNTITPPASGSGSKSSTQDASDGGIRRAPIHFALFLLFIASMIAKF